MHIYICILNSYYIIPVKLPSTAAYPYSYTCSNFTLRIVQSTVQNDVFGDHMSAMYSSSPYDHQNTILHCLQYRLYCL
jgi:hypothetical protein